MDAEMACREGRSLECEDFGHIYEAFQTYPGEIALIETATGSFGSVMRVCTRNAVLQWDDNGFTMESIENREAAQSDAEDGAPVEAFSRLLAKELATRPYASAQIVLDCPVASIPVWSPRFWVAVTMAASGPLQQYCHALHAAVADNQTRLKQLLQSSPLADYGLVDRDRMKQNIAFCLRPEHACHTGYLGILFYLDRFLRAYA